MANSANADSASATNWDHDFLVEAARIAGAEARATAALISGAGAALVARLRDVGDDVTNSMTTAAAGAGAALTVREWFASVWVERAVVMGLCAAAGAIASHYLAPRFSEHEPHHDDDDLHHHHHTHADGHAHAHDHAHHCEHKHELRADVVERLCALRGVVQEGHWGQLSGRRAGPLGVPHVFDLSRSTGRSTCLVVVDMQEGFFPPSPDAVPFVKAAVPHVNAVATAVREAGGVVCWVVSDVGADSIEGWSALYSGVLGFERDMATAAIARNSDRDFGAGYDPKRAAHGMDGPLHADLDLHPTDWVVKKDRYSPFGRGGLHQARTASDGPWPSRAAVADAGDAFEKRLHAAGIDTVLLAGCQTSVCVESTARAALQANFRVVVVADACADLTCADHNASLCAVAQWIGDVRLAREVISELA